MSNVYGYDVTAANNSTVGGQDVSEGVMPVNKINDAMRGMASELAKFRNDIGGANTTTGTANAHALTTSSVIAALGDGKPITFIAGQTNTSFSGVTLNVDSLGAKPIKAYYPDGLANPAVGEIRAGQPYTVIYDASIGSGTWILTTTPLSGGRVIDIQDFTASGTWTSPTTYDGSWIFVEVWGAGGGGGEALAAGSTAEGGGGGQYQALLIPRQYLLVDVTVTIGAGGAGATASTGGGGSAGGQTTFGVILGAKGGDGGDGSVGSGSAATAWTAATYLSAPVSEITKAGAAVSDPDADGNDSLYAGAGGAGAINTTGNNNTGGAADYLASDGGSWDFTTGVNAGDACCGGSAGKSGQGGAAGGGGYVYVTIFG